MSRQVNRLKLVKRRHRQGDTDSDVSVSGCGPTRDRGGSPPNKHPNVAEGDGIRGNKLVPKWQRLAAEHMDCKYCLLYTRSEADDLFARCHGELVYNSGRLAQVRLFGRWRDIPRKQVAHGDDGLTYTFSGVTIPARPWTPLLREIKTRIENATGKLFNFVLINRYENGLDHIGEHQDNEKDLAPRGTIASLSLGQSRDFIFRHRDARGRNAPRKIPRVTVTLQHGMLLVMDHPTNVYWYHSLPLRRNLHGVRVNLTVRQMVTGVF